MSHRTKFICLSRNIFLHPTPGYTQHILSSVPWGFSVCVLIIVPKVYTTPVSLRLMVQSWESWHHIQLPMGVIVMLHKIGFRWFIHTLKLIVILHDFLINSFWIYFGNLKILWPSYLHNGISYTGKTTSLYWIRAQEVSEMISLCSPFGSVAYVVQPHMVPYPQHYHYHCILS